MRFCDIATELRPFLPKQKSQGKYVVSLINMVLRDPMDDEEAKEKSKGIYNPIANLDPDTLRRYLKGDKKISEANAAIICKRYDTTNLADRIDDLVDSEQDQLHDFLTRQGLDVQRKDLGYAYADILCQIFHGLAAGIENIDVQITLYNKPSLATLKSDRVYYDREKHSLVIDNDIIPLPEFFSMEDFIKEESSGRHKFVTEMMNAYAEGQGCTPSEIGDISSLAMKYQIDYEGHIEAYVSAEDIQRSVRDVYSDGKNQFDILKDDAYNNIRLTYYDDELKTGASRLRAVTSRAADANLEKSTLSHFTNLIGSQEKWGLVHILVEDGRIPSWVDPYGEGRNR